MEILDQVRDVLDVHAFGGIDWVTFAGLGKKTLHAGLGEMIRGVKCLTEIVVAVIINGSLLYKPGVREKS